MTEQRVVLVTGATSGIGNAICERFGESAYYVFAHGRDKDKCHAAVAELQAKGIKAEPVVADLAEATGVEEVVRQLIASGRSITDLINNAGGVLETAFEPGVVVDPLPTYQVNVFAAYELSVRCADQLGTTSIVNVSSVHGSAPWGGRLPHYSGSKAALSHLTKMLAIKLAPSVRVNAVSPGRTKTSAWGEPSPQESKALADDQLIKRWIEPAEVADAVWFLSQNGACTGTDLLIDGGMSISAVVSNT